MFSHLISDLNISNVALNPVQTRAVHVSNSKTNEKIQNQSKIHCAVRCAAVVEAKQLHDVDADLMNRKCDLGCVINVSYG